MPNKQLSACPNPWCEALERHGDYSPAVRLHHHGNYRVVCTSCLLEGPLQPTEAEAIAAWNRRPNPPADVAGLNLGALWQPTEAQWGGLARAIMMWLDFDDKTPRALFRHLKNSGHEIPQWLRDEGEMQALDHVPSKGTRCVLIWKAMLSALPDATEAAALLSSQAIEIAALRAERDRLREALKRVLSDEEIALSRPDYEFARQALGGPHD